MIRSLAWGATFLSASLLTGSLLPAAEPAGLSFKGALLASEAVTPTRLAELHRDKFTVVVLALREDSASSLQADRAAAERVKEAGLALWYWIEIARHPQLAEQHPRWMASLQGHPEWRRFFPDFPKPQKGEVVKCYPWVPILYQETFDAHRDRVAKLLGSLPLPRGVLLNDLQGPPSACGCGNPVCRWTADYGPIQTATPLGEDAAARFVAAVRQTAGAGVQVVPVWTTECEAHDVAKEGLCAGVGCFKGICWKAYTRQLKEVAEESPTIGALLLYKTFQQDSTEYPEPAGWVGHALRGFQTIPPKHGGKAVAPERLVAVLQGWNVTPAELAAQQQQAQSAGVAATVVAFEPIEQSWSPRIVSIQP